MTRTRFKKIHFYQNQKLPEFVQDMIDDGTLIKIEDDGVDFDELDTYVVRDGADVELVENIKYHVIINGKLLSLYKFPFCVTVGSSEED